MITSAQNKRVARAVRLKKRSIRERDRRFLVEGAQAVTEAIAAGMAEVVFHTPDQGERLAPVFGRAAEAGVQVHEVSEAVMAHLTSTVTPQGVVSVARFVDVALGALPPEARSVAVLVEVRDPGNAGTILRSADAAGADGVVFTTASVDVYNEKAVRATAGSLFHVPVVREVGVDEAVAALRERGMRILAATARGEASVWEADLAAPTAVLFGNEAHGLSPSVIELADATVRVPIHPRAESLNLAAAVALVLFELARPRSTRGSLAGTVASAAHEIRSPLAAILGFGTTLRRKWEALADEEKRSMVEAMTFDARRMRVLVAQLVDAARLASGRLELSRERVDVLTAVERVRAELNRPELPAVTVTGREAVAAVDPQRLETMIRAMVEAAAWWGEAGPVRVDVSAADGARVEVFRAARSLEESTIREMLSPPDSSARGGTAFGLHVAAGLARAHGGSLEARGEGGIALVLLLPP